MSEDVGEKGCEGLDAVGVGEEREAEEGGVQFVQSEAFEGVNEIGVGEGVEFGMGGEVRDRSVVGVVGEV